MSSSELDSLAYTSSSSSVHGSSSSSFLCWDYHNLGLLNVDTKSLVMDGIAPSSLEFSSSHSDFSSGYLEDALLEFTERSKRRRLLPPSCADESTMIYHTELEKSFWNFNPIWHRPAENIYCMNNVESFSEFSDEEIGNCMSRANDEVSILAEIETPQETISASQSPHSSSSSYNKHSLSSKTQDDTLLYIGSEDEKRKKRVITRVAYPFALVKPGGREGDVTLNDINERILMRPTRPVKHPVGDFACQPCVFSSTGLSGKAVVALTRIHTQGRRGTITIIRTKG